MPAVEKPEWLQEIERQFGIGVLRRADELAPQEYRSSGSLALDVALGGGWPKRRVIDLVGKESSGKTLIFEMAAIAAQREEGLRSLIFDLEGTFSTERFRMLGGDPTMLDIIRAENVSDRNAPLLFGEHAVDMTKILLRASEKHACICFDSTGSMISVAEYETKMEKGQEKATMTQTARLMSDSLRVLVGSGMLARSANGVTLFFISQLRDNIGARPMRGIPPPDKKTGGRALRFYASVQAEVIKGDRLKGDVTNDFGRNEKGVEVGGETKIRIRKQKCNRFQGRVAAFQIYHEGEVTGMDRIDELAKLSILTGVVNQSGSWLTLPSIPGARSLRFQGVDKLKTVLATTLTFNEVYRQTKEALARMMDNRALPSEELTDEALFQGGTVIDGDNEANRQTEASA